MSDGAERALSMHQNTANERLVYLALRERDHALTPAEAADIVGVSRHTAGKALDQLDSDGWAESISRPTDGRGRNPTEYQPRAECEICGETFGWEDYWQGRILLGNPAENDFECDDCQERTGKWYDRLTNNQRITEWIE